MLPFFLPQLLVLASSTSLSSGSNNRVLPNAKIGFGVSKAISAVDSVERTSTQAPVLARRFLAAVSEFEIAMTRTEPVPARLPLMRDLNKRQKQSGLGAGLGYGDYWTLDSRPTP